MRHGLYGIPMTLHTPFLLMLGTGSAFPAHSYNECFLIDTGVGKLLVDGGGGNGIINMLDRTELDIATIHDFFVTHTHTDHILGAIWVIRRIVQLYIENKYEGTLDIYGNTEVINALIEICRLTFLPAYFTAMKTVACFNTVEPGENRLIAGTDVRFIDCHSANTMQTGFRMHLPSGKIFCCLGDEALTKANLSETAGVDYLLCGAFCRYADKDIFRPYDKHHSTVRDVAINAATARISTLILAHCEDRMPGDRNALYAAEAAQYYSGTVIVPNDADRIDLV